MASRAARSPVRGDCPERCLTRCPRPEWFRARQGRRAVTAHDLNGIIREGGASLRILRADGRRFPVVRNAPGNPANPAGRIAGCPCENAVTCRSAWSRRRMSGNVQHRIKPQITGLQIARLRPAGAVFRVPFPRTACPSDEVAAFWQCPRSWRISSALLIHGAEDVVLGTGPGKIRMMSRRLMASSTNLGARTGDVAQLPGGQFCSCMLASSSR